MPLIIETFKTSSHPNFAAIKEWSNQYVIDTSRVYDHIDHYDMAKSIAMAEAHFLGNHVTIEYAVTREVSWSGEESQALEFQSFHRANIAGYGLQPNPLGPEWGVRVNKFADTGRGGAWVWRGVCDESDTVKVTHLTRKWSRAANAEKVMSVWWRFRLGDIADAFLTMQKRGTLPGYQNVVSVSFGGIGCMANARKFYQYRDGGGWETRVQLRNTLRDVQDFIRTIKEQAPLNDEYNPPGWISYTALLLQRMSEVGGNVVSWMYNPNGVPAPCTIGPPMKSRFGITLSEGIEVVAPIRIVTCSIVVPGLVEGVDSSQTKKVREDVEQVVATETWYDEFGGHYVRVADAMKLLVPLYEYLGIIEQLFYADYLNAVNNLAPGYSTGTPSEAFTGRKGTRRN